MPTPPLTDNDHRLAWSLYAAGVAQGYLRLDEPVYAGKTKATVYVAAQMGLTQATALRRVHAALAHLGDPTQPAEPAAPSPEPLAPTPIDDVEGRRASNEAAFLRSRVKALEERTISSEAWQDKFLQMRNAKLERVDWLPKPHIRRPNSLVPMLFSSDFQVGEVIRAEEIDGINAYNTTIFEQRYQAMIDKTISLATTATGADEFPYAVYLRGGDALSGEIHQELAETNDVSSVPAVKLLLRQERAGIRRLRDKFKKIRVISIPGNHGRTTFKPRAKGYTERNYETLLAWWLADSFGDDPNVEFYTPPSGDAQFDVLGWNFLLAHGDRMGSRGGQGFVGPAATIARGHQKLYQAWSATERPLHCILTGHLHTSLKLQRGYANGSLAGYSEYARDMQALPDAAKQWLFFIHREHMISHAFELQLSERPKRTGAGEAAFA